MTAGCCGGNEKTENNGGNNMMPDMAKKMMSNMQNKKFSPQEMCEKTVLFFLSRLIKDKTVEVTALKLK